VRVYYFTSAKYGLDNLKKKRLKISDFSNLNDPFELLGVEMSDKDVRKALQFEKSSIAKNKGLLCFSESKYDPVQWAHYGENHKGICLGFDVSDKNLKKIKYVSSRLAKSTLNDPEKLDKILTTKFKHWEYEQEHRLIIDITGKKSENRLFFEEFSDDIVLKEIYIGCQSDLKFKDIKTNYNSKEKNVLVKHTRPAFKDFRIVWDQKKKSEHA
jgi:hypothetical protein